MLAWLLEHAGRERALLTQLFGAPEAEAAVEVGPLLGKVFEGVCRPLKARLDQVLQVTTNEHTHTLPLPPTHPTIFARSPALFPPQYSRD